MLKDENNIHSGHRQRLRKLSFNAGIENLPEHQILELILSYIIPRKDTNPLAHALISEFGNLTNVFDAPPEHLKKVKGIGETAASFINLCSQIPLVYKKNQSQEKAVLDSPQKVIEYLRSTISITNTEKFYLTYINNKCELIKTETFGSGFINSVQINFRELMKNVLKLPVGGVVVCHTHPHGDAKPSLADIKFTRQFLLGLNSVGIPLLDHIILTPKSSFSFLNSGELNNYNNEFKNILDQVNYVATAPIFFHKD